MERETEKRLLIFTQFSPDSALGGPAILRYWVSKITNAQIHWVSLDPSAGFAPVAHSHLTIERIVLVMRGNTWPGTREFWKWFYRAVWSNYVVYRLRRRIETFRPDTIWIVFDHSLGAILARLAPLLGGRRVHVSIHDAPLAKAKRTGDTLRFQRDIRRAKHRLSRCGVSFDVISEELGAAEIDGPTRTAVVTLPVESAQCAARFRCPAQAGPLRIGFAGNSYGDREFRALVAALQRWSLRTGRDWSITSYGHPGFAAFHPKVTAFGLTPLEEVRAGLADCDALLLPWEVGAEQFLTSLPTKLVSYAELGRPIFAIVPAGSATARVVCEHHLGPIVTDLSEAAFDSALDALITWDCEAGERGWRALLAGRFSAERIGRDLAALLGVEIRVSGSIAAAMNHADGGSLQQALSAR